MNGKTQLTLPGGRRYDFAAICGAKTTVHAELFRRAVTPRMSGLAGWEFKGRNLSVVSLLLGIRRFTKGFFADRPCEGEPESIDGYNIWVVQKGEPADTWIPVRKNGEPHRHGFYKVLPACNSRTDHKFPHALLLDYSLGENPWHHPGRVLKDYLAQVYPDNPDLLIGNAYAALGSSRIFGGYFVLERAAKGPADPCG